MLVLITSIVQTFVSHVENEMLILSLPTMNLPEMDRHVCILSVYMNNND